MPDTSPENPIRNNTLVKIVRAALEYGVSHRQHYMLPEHLLLLALSYPSFTRYYKGLFELRHGASLQECLSNLVTYIDANSERMSRLREPVRTPGFERVFQETLLAFKKQRGRHVAVCFLVGMLKEPDCYGSSMLRQLGITEEVLAKDCEQPVAEGLDENDGDDFGELFGGPDDGVDGRRGAEKSKTPFLDQYSVELVAQAKAGKIDPLIGRITEVERLIEILHKKRSNNALIVGNEGTGKTAIVEGLALRIANGEVPESIRDFKIYAVEMGAMVAGSELRGSFEKRLEGVIKEAAANPKCFVFIDELHSVIGAGSGRDGTLDASNILKPYLARGEIRCIGTTTYDEYQKRIISDRAFARRFKKLDLSEPSPAETLKILEGLAPSYEKFHGVKFPAPILEQIVSLSQRYVNGKYFPDKAIDILDECGARYHCGLKKGTEVTSEDVEEVICQASNLPSLTVENDDRELLRHLADRIKAQLFGQDEAVDELVRCVKIAKAGFQDPRKPLLTAFLCGTSGCGKTELARQLAAQLGIAFVKLDMSEYNEEYSSSRLIGSAPGYIGYERPGALTEPVIQTPHCLILLDEIEKAHLSVFNLLLQVMDEGRLKDNKGREASFRNAILIMTSNVGSRDASGAIQLLGFNKTDEEQSRNRQEIIQRVLKKTFPPEFRNRIQCTLMMNDLNLQAIQQIVGKDVGLLNAALKDRKVTITLTAAAAQHLAQTANAEQLGGRPVERLIDSVIKQKIVDEILFGKLASGGAVTVGWQAAPVEYTYTYSF